MNKIKKNRIKVKTKTKKLTICNWSIYKGTLPEFVSKRKVLKGGGGMIKSKQTENQKIVWDWTSFLFILFLRMRPHTRTHCTKKGDCEGEARCLRATYTRGREHHSLLELPAEILNKILEYISFKEHATVRRVSQEINIKIKETIATGFPKWIFFLGGRGLNLDGLVGRVLNRDGLGKRGLNLDGFSGSKLLFTPIYQNDY